MSEESSVNSQRQSEQALVSVIIRTHNRGGFLRRAIKSVLDQDYATVEVLVVNDGSEQLNALHDEFDASSLSLRIVNTVAPGGRVSAANLGLSEARGEYLIFLDDDDWFYPDHLSKLVGALAENLNADLAYTGVECKRLQSDGSRLITEHVFDQPFHSAFFLIQNFIPIHAALFKRSLLDEKTCFDESLDLYEDWDFWMQLWHKTEFQYVPGLSACYYLGNEASSEAADSQNVEGDDKRESEASGFGLEKDTGRQHKAEALFFNKWRHLWTEEELALIIGIAREVPALRQGLHDTNVTLQGVYKNLAQEIGQHQQLSTQYQALLTQSHQLKSEYDNTRKTLELTLNSRSWKLTAPLRSMLEFMRRCKSALLRRAQNNTLLSASLGLEDSAKIRPYPMRKLEAKDFAKVAQSLRFQSDKAPLVSIIIPVYEHLALSLACLQSIFENPQQSSFEVIVVDDCSTDQSSTILSSISGLRYLRNESNSGFIRTCNKGAAAARGKYLFFLNNDTEVQAQWLDPLVSVLETDAQVGIAGSKLVYPSGYLQEAGASLRADGSVDLNGLNENPNLPRYCRLREVDHCSGAAILIKAELFKHVGGFDEIYAPAYFEDCDLSLKVRKAGYRIMYQPESVIVHYLSVSTQNLPEGKMGQINKNKAIYLERWQEVLQEEDKVRLIAFYLPQYHPIPENDEWWGEGFTEWTNVNRSKPLFEGHIQPHRPADLGYYDLRDPEVSELQAALAREHGIYGFCYYYYWFNGKRLLERPLDDMLARGTPDFPFCVCWANENWTRRWDGKESEVLMAQNYNNESNLQFIHDVLPLLQDERYIRIKGRPLLLIYRAELIPELGAAIIEWRRITREAGLGEVYLAAVESFSGVNKDLAEEFDALVEFPPHGRSVAVKKPPAGLQEGFEGQLFDYPASAKNFIERTDCSPTLFRTAMPAWDNTARRQQAAHIYLNSSPAEYQAWLEALLSQARNQRMGDERIVFVNAWNEWAEGNHLEPDEHYGSEYLQATRKALGSMGHYLGSKQTNK